MNIILRINSTKGISDSIAYVTLLNPIIKREICIAENNL
jgi:hypothetical protein